MWTGLIWVRIEHIRSVLVMQCKTMITGRHWWLCGAWEKSSMHLQLKE